MLETENLTLLSCNFKLLETILKGNEALTEFLNKKVPAEWTEFGEPAFRYSYVRLQENPEELPWLCYLIILKSENTLIGSCGFKGKPDSSGMVEIGYEICKEFRNRHYASEAAGALIKYALGEDEVKVVRAHTLPDNLGSIKVLQNNGMVFIGQFSDPEDGDVLRWEIRKDKN